MNTDIGEHLMQNICVHPRASAGRPAPGGAGGRGGLMIDGKGEGFGAAVVAGIHAAGLPCEQIVVPGGSRRSRALIRGLDTKIPLSLSLDADWDERISPEFIAQIDTEAVTWRH